MRSNHAFVLWSRWVRHIYSSTKQIWIKKLPRGFYSSVFGYRFCLRASITFNTGEFIRLEQGDTMLLNHDFDFVFHKFLSSMKLVWPRRGASGSVLTFDERRERRLSILVRLNIAFWPNQSILNFCGCNLDCSSFSQAFPRPHAVDPCQPRRRPDQVFITNPYKINKMQLLRLRRTKFLFEAIF